MQVRADSETAVTHRRYSFVRIPARKSPVHAARSHGPGRVTFVVGHFFSGDSRARLRGRWAGDRVVSG